MSKYLIIFILLCVSIGASAEENDLELALSTYIDANLPNYEVAYYDLNSDGLQDAFIYLNDRNWCGSGGCTALIFKGTASGLSFLSKTMIVNKPIIVSSAKSFGWFNLIVNTGGIGSVLLKSDGNKYPLNPSVQPTIDITKEPGGYVLFK